jgi:hypothetical protein
MGEGHALLLQSSSFPDASPPLQMHFMDVYQCVFTVILLIQIVVKGRKTNDRPKRPLLEAENSVILGHQSLCHDLSRKINDVLVQQFAKRL